MKRLMCSIALSLALALVLLAMPVLADEGGTVLLGQLVTLEEGQVRQGDLVLIGGQITLQPGSRLTGDLAVIGGNAEIAGEVDGSVAVVGGTVSLAKGAHVHGDVSVTGTLRYRDPEAVVEGEVFQGDVAEIWSHLPNAPGKWGLAQLGADAQRPVPTTPKPEGGWGKGGFLLVSLLLTVAAMAVVPENVHNTRRVMLSSPLLSLGIGLLTALVVAVLIPLLVVLCIGIPVAVVLALGLAVCVVLGWAALAHLVGDKALTWFKIQASPVAQAGVGAFVIGVLALVPCLGVLAAALAVCWGVGAVVLTRFGTRLDPLWTLNGGPNSRPPTEPASRPWTTIDAAPDEGSANAPGDEGGTRPLDERDLDDLEREANDELDSL
ncbi:MAG: polymer-forming cytoskeletal protein [Anaerolineales bacterium]